MAHRKPNERETHLIRTLADAAHGLRADANWIEQLLVEPLADGGMGSLRLHLHGCAERDQKFGRVGSELMFKDVDGVDVIATLYLDEIGAPFELDVWKVTYAPLIQIPEVLPLAHSPTV